MARWIEKCRKHEIRERLAHYRQAVSNYQLNVEHCRNSGIDLKYAGKPPEFPVLPVPYREVLRRWGSAS